MNTVTYRLELEGIPVDVSLKNIRHLYIRVCVRTGAVKISAPCKSGRGAIEKFARKKLAWIKKNRPENPRPAGSSLKYVTGEIHYYGGRAFTLRVLEGEGRSRAALRGSSEIRLHVKKGSGAEKRRHVLEEWYRARLKEKIPPLAEKWEEITGVRVDSWRVRKMKTRWGTCSINERRVWLNLELAKKPARCLEYIVVHEMVHLIEPGHNKRYKALMDGFLPDWRLRRKELDSFPEAPAEAVSR